MVLLALLLSAAAPRALAAGLPELPGDIHGFLRPAAVDAPAVRGAPVQDPWIEKARGYYRGLRAKGYVVADADFVAEDHADDHSPGTAEFDFQHQRCTVALNERLMKVSGFDKPFLFKFMIYHELQHCHLYANPREIRPVPSLSPRAATMLSDLIQLDYFQPAEEDEEPRVNGYGLYHETFADVKAMGVLLAEGTPRSRVDELVRFRQGGGMMPTDPHGTAGALAGAAAVDWASLDAAGIDAKARELADAAMTGFLRKYIQPEAFAAKATDFLAGRLQTPVTDMNESGVSAKLRVDLRDRMANGILSKNPAWRAYAGLVLTGASDADVADGYFRSRYGASAAELQPENLEIQRAIAR